MAKTDTTQLILYGALAYIGYRYAESQGWLKDKKKAADPSAPSAPSTPYVPGPAPTPGSRLDQLIAQNPNFYIQMRDWQQARLWKGEDWHDWNAFKAHLVAIGAPNPGDPPPPEFYASGLT